MDDSWPSSEVSWPRKNPEECAAGIGHDGVIDPVE